MAMMGYLRTNTGFCCGTRLSFTTRYRLPLRANMAIAVLAAATLVAPAFAEKCVALVIGNGNYANLPAATRSSGLHGLAVVAQEPPETVVLYSTAAGQTTSDDVAGSSPCRTAPVNDLPSDSQMVTVLYIDGKKESRTVTISSGGTTTVGLIADKIYVDIRTHHEPCVQLIF